jgi:hypothetical protein
MNKPKTTFILLEAASCEGATYAVPSTVGSPATAANQNNRKGAWLSCGYDGASTEGGAR